MENGWELRRQRFKGQTCGSKRNEEDNLDFLKPAKTKTKNLGSFLMSQSHVKAYFRQGNLMKNQRTLLIRWLVMKFELYFPLAFNKL